MARDLTSSVLRDLLALTTAALDPAPSRAFVAAGDVAWDDCCDGQTWVRLTTITPQPPTGQNCQINWWDLAVEVGILRCAHTIDDAGRAPAPYDLTTEAGEQGRDLWALNEAIVCYATEIPSVVRVDMGAWTPSGPEGGCVGGAWAATLRVHPCGCPSGSPSPLGASPSPLGPS